MNKNIVYAGLFAVALLLIFNTPGIAHASCPTTFQSQYDVNNDGLISTADANLISTYINQHGSQPASANPAYDVDDDGTISGSDPLAIINYVNAGCIARDTSNITCSTSADCGPSQFIGNQFCSNG